MKIKIEKCIICDNQKKHIIFNEIREGKRDVFKCSNCGFIYLDFIEHVDYQLSYKSKTVKANQTLENQLIERANSLVPIFKIFLRFQKNKNILNLLDFGSGLSPLYYLLKKNDSKINYYGFEKNKEYINFLKKFYSESKHKKIFFSSIDNQLKSKTFQERIGKSQTNCIIALHVFEHLIDQINFLNNIYQLMNNKNIFIFLVMPNYDDFYINNLKSKSLYEYKKFTFHNAHPYYYDISTFKKLIKKQKNFKIHKIFTFQEYSLKNYFNWVIKKTHQHSISSAQDLSIDHEIDNFFKSFANKNNFGSSLVAILKNT